MTDYFAGTHPRPLIAVPPRHSTDNQADLLPQIRTERARRVLLAADDRAPLGWEHGLSLASLKPMRGGDDG